MRRALAVLGLVGCSFNPATLPSGADGPSDGPLASDGPLDAAPTDAPRPADAPATDAPANPCPGPLGTLKLSTPVANGLGQPSRYTPTCETVGSSGGEDFYRLDLTSSPDTDLVFDLTEAATLQAVIDVTSSCQGAPGGVGICASVGAPGAGEAVVVPFAQSGTRFVTVDSAVGTAGLYNMTAFLRAIVARHGACDATLQASRCTIGNYCVDLQNDGTPSCEPLTATVDSNTGSGTAACSSAPSLTDDSTVLGSLGASDEVDIFALVPGRTTHMRAVVDDGIAGGCPMDAVLEVVSGTSCPSAIVIASDDNSGLGPCPRLDDVMLFGGNKYWLRIHLANGAPVQSAMYSLVVDYF